MRSKEIDAIVAYAKVEIERDVLNGIVPKTVSSFKELYDYVGGYDYGAEEYTGAYQGVVQEATAIVDAWLQTRPFA